jgi:hypothetical protein
VVRCISPGGDIEYSVFALQLVSNTYVNG